MNDTDKHPRDRERGMKKEVKLACAREGFHRQRGNRKERKEEKRAAVLCLEEAI